MGRVSRDCGIGSLGRTTRIAMKRKNLIIGFLAFSILLVVAFWLFTSSITPASSGRISVTFVGYTNDATGIPLFGYATSNVSHAGFAVLRAHNLSQSTFSGYVGPILIHRTAATGGEVIRLKGALQTAAVRGTPIIGHDFQLSPGAVVIFAVPAPDFHGKWQCGLSVTHIYNYRYQWELDAVVFAQQCGFHFGEGGQFAMSTEIVR
jgi:hypothetical protein